ncbi:type 2 lanthipeptide synthetase LanM family protein [Luteimonas salinisoli]|nr:type 2 lanthipeptide synthetase LanM family protein [Luteimonas salinisoli]
MGGLATRLASIEGLRAGERAVVVEATREALRDVLHAKLGRLLVLELNAARVTGRLRAATAGDRWREFLEISSRRAFWDDLSEHYPPLHARVETILDNRCAASVALARHWVRDREHLSALLGGPPGAMLELRFGAGDSHRGGRTVAMIRAEGGRTVYKPRSLAVDAALADFIAFVAERHAGAVTMRVPRSWSGADHGWVEFIEHRHARDDGELRGFYRGIGHWLALMRLLAGSDLHAENLIAHGGEPVVVDCETLFTPVFAPRVSDYGQAQDRAAGLVARTVLNVGLLPGRGVGLGWRGIDSSALGMLPGQQPMVAQPGILSAGSDQARIGTTLVAAPVARNHPSEHPALAQYWPEVLAGFDAMTATLQRLDRDGVLRARLEPFAACHTRVVPRATEVYAEVGRMLWHPVSLHDPEPARQRAFELLRKMAGNVATAPDDPAVVHAEIMDLEEGDIPFFAGCVGEGVYSGPGGTRWGPGGNLVDQSLAHWRTADFGLERGVIQASLVSAYINDGWMPDEASMLPERGRGGDLDARRRRQAASIVQAMADRSIRAGDGSIAWIAPVLDPTGWSVQPLQQDLYSGMSGLAVLAGAYLQEVAGGRADPVAGLDAVLDDTLRTLGLFEAKRERLQRQGLKVRPLPPGGYIGLGSQIWTHLLLAQWGLDGGRGIERAEALAAQLPVSIAADEVHDLLSGAAGAIVPLIALAEISGDSRHLGLAREAGDRLCAHAVRRDGRAWWVHGQWPEGVGGFAHGVTGIGWALQRLARATGEERYAEVAAGAFAFEDALFDATERNWRDLRNLEGGTGTAAAWCHGSVGIGLAHLDLDPALADGRTRALVRDAALATHRLGLGWNHCACHGDASAWELLDRAIAAGEGPDGMHRDRLLDLLLTSLEEHGPSCGLARDAFVPGLLPGVGGVAYQLLRAHPDSRLPTILTPGGGLV